MSLDAVERQRMPFVGETGGGRRRGIGAAGESGTGADRAGLPMDPALAERLAEARRRPTPISITTARASRDRCGERPGGRWPARPAPDPIARDYLLLALRLDQHIPGLVDGYFGPADLKAQVDMEQLRAAGPPARRRAPRSRDRLPAEVAEPDRRAWLDAQLVGARDAGRGARRRRRCRTSST